MKPRREENLIIYYIYLAVGCAAVGVATTFLVLLICQIYNIDIIQHIWILAIPIVVAIGTNVTAIEIYRKYRNKNG